MLLATTERMTLRSTPGRRDEDADAVDGEHPQRKEDPLPELRDLGDVRESAECHGNRGASA